MSFYHRDPLSPFASYMEDTSVEEKLLAQGSAPLLQDLVDTVHFSVVASRLIGHKVSEEEISFYTYCAVNQIPHHQVVETALQVKLNLDITFEQILAKKKFLGKCYIDSFYDLDKNELIVDRLSLIPYDCPEEEKVLYDEIVYGSKYCIQTDNEYDRYRHLFYTGTHILKNYLTLKDRRTLIEIEKILILSGAIEFWKQLQCLDNNLRCPRGFSLLMMLSEFFYGTLYPCAGLLRTYVIPGCQEDDNQHGFGLNYLSFNALDLNLEKDLARLLKERYRKVEHHDFQGHQGYLGRALAIWHQIFKAKPLHMGNSLISFFYLKVICKTLGINFKLEQALANFELRKELDYWASLYTYQEWSEEAYQALPLKDYLSYGQGFTLAIEERIFEGEAEATPSQDQDCSEEKIREEGSKDCCQEDSFTKPGNPETVNASSLKDLNVLSNCCPDDVFTYLSKVSKERKNKGQGDETRRHEANKDKLAKKQIAKEQIANGQIAKEQITKEQIAKEQASQDKGFKKQASQDKVSIDKTNTDKTSQVNKEASSAFEGFKEDYLNQEGNSSQSLFTPINLPFLLSSNKALVAELMEEAKAGFCSTQTHQVRECGLTKPKEEK